MGGAPVLRRHGGQRSSAPAGWPPRRPAAAPVAVPARGRGTNREAGPWAGAARVGPGGRICAGRSAPDFAPGAPPPPAAPAPRAAGAAPAPGAGCDAFSVSIEDARGRRQPRSRGCAPAARPPASPNPWARAPRPRRARAPVADTTQHQFPPSERAIRPPRRRAPPRPPPQPGACATARVAGRATAQMKAVTLLLVFWAGCAAARPAWFGARAAGRGRRSSQARRRPGCARGAGAGGGPPPPPLHRARAQGRAAAAAAAAAQPSPHRGSAAAHELICAPTARPAPSPRLTLPSRRAAAGFARPLLPAPPHPTPAPTPPRPPPHPGPHPARPPHPAPPRPRQTGRRLHQKDPDFVTGTNVLRTNRFSKLSNGAASELQAQDAQSAARAGDTTFLASSQQSYVAGRTSRDDRNALAGQVTQAAVQSAAPRTASNTATGQTALFSAASTSSLRSSSSLRASLASDGTASAIQVRVAPHLRAPLPAARPCSSSVANSFARPPARPAPPLKPRLPSRSTPWTPSPLPSAPWTTRTTRSAPPPRAPRARAA
jgi:hypothetical protein